MQLGGLAGLTALTMGIGQDGAAAKAPAVNGAHVDGNGQSAEADLLSR
jgi:hypothetical protein